MRMWMNRAVMAIMVCAVAGILRADEGKKECECPIGKAMAKLPKMTYKVGDESICCAKSAAALSKKVNQPVQYVVAEESFTDEHDAFVALVDVTEKFVDDFTTVKKCDKSGCTTVAGQQIECCQAAEKIAKVVKEAADSVHVSFKVGDEKCDCPLKADELAKSTGAKKEFVVGKESTCCDVTARLKVAQAKYKAVVEALAKVTAEEAKAKVET